MQWIWIFICLLSPVGASVCENWCSSSGWVCDYVCGDLVSENLALRQQLKTRFIPTPLLPTKGNSTDRFRECDAKLQAQTRVVDHLQQQLDQLDHDVLTTGQELEECRRDFQNLPLSAQPGEDRSRHREKYMAPMLVLLGWGLRGVLVLLT